MERGLFIKTQKGPGGPGPNEFMIQWVVIAEAETQSLLYSGFATAVVWKRATMYFLPPTSQVAAAT